MSNPQSELVEFLAQFTHDPLGFVYSCFPWGKDELANYKGPDAWQIEILEKLGKGLINIEEAIEEEFNIIISPSEVKREDMATPNKIINIIRERM